MATSGHTTTSTMDTTKDDFAPLGSFPIIDLELVTDYGKPVGDLLRQFFRIHIDIPISDPTKFGKIREALDREDEGQVYADIKSTLPSKKPDNKRAHAVVDAALKPEPM